MLTTPARAYYNEDTESVDGRDPKIMNFLGGQNREKETACTCCDAAVRRNRTRLLRFYDEVQEDRG